MFKNIFSNNKNLSPLNTALKKFASKPSDNTLLVYQQILKEYTDRGEWVHMLLKSADTHELALTESQNKVYAIMLSDASEFRKDSGYSIVLTDINKLIDAVFSNPDIDGILIDPFSTMLYMDKSFLLKSILHSNSNVETYENNPYANIKFENTTYRNLLKFTIHTVLEEECENGYNFVSATDNPDIIPNIILSKDNKVILVHTKPLLESTSVDFTDKEIHTLTSLKNKYNIDVLLAPVEISPANKLLSEKGIFPAEDGLYLYYLVL